MSLALVAARGGLLAAVALLILRAAGNCGTDRRNLFSHPPRKGPHGHSRFHQGLDRSRPRLHTVDVAGDGQHFEALVVSDAFRGLSRLARHRLVYAALGDRMRAEIHALSMTTVTPDEHARH